jgi:hypothetical protein
MSAASNPLGTIENIRFSRHAAFRMNDRGFSPAEIMNGIRAPQAQMKIDSKTGHYVVRIGRYRVVLRKEENGTATVLTVLDKAL